ncbi:hypothetical protein ACL02U_17690 [Streptomyces sp. MS06]|uniref:hypothetical protein n=1 Tax=Streptomyces sp. MS06 TaxID=3385974 RepID=UPI0039A38C5B
MNLFRRTAASVLATGALLFAAVQPSHAAPAESGTAAAATPAAATATQVGPVRITVQGFGSGPDNVAYQLAFATAYHQAAQYGFSSGQCRVTFGPVHLLYLPSGFGQWALELTCSGEPAVTSSTRDLTRYNDGTDHRSTTWNVPSRFNKEGVLGKLLMKPASGTRPLYMCQVGKDTFTSMDVNCEGQKYLTRLGWIYRTKPSGVSTRPIKRCTVLGSGEHFDSVNMQCEGQHQEGILGYALT